MPQPWEKPRPGRVPHDRIMKKRTCPLPFLPVDPDDRHWRNDRKVGGTHACINDAVGRRDIPPAAAVARPSGAGRCGKSVGIPKKRTHRCVPLHAVAHRCTPLHTVKSAGVLRHFHRTSQRLCSGGAHGSRLQRSTYVPVYVTHLVLVAGGPGG
eukprot:gene16368-biopygen15820